MRNTPLLKFGKVHVHVPVKASAADAPFACVDKLNLYGTVGSDRQK